ncbi:MAG: RNA polymerase sigma factor [Bacillota bacterium]
MLRMAQGDMQAFERLYSAYSAQVRAFVFRHENASTDDLTQEVFLRVWRHRHRFRGDSSAKTYLIGIARNVLREQNRADRNRARHPSADIDEVAAPGVEETWVDAGVIVTLDQAKASLPANQSQAIELVYYLGIKPAQAAAMVGCSCKAMRRRLEEARARLRRLLGHLMRT